MNKEMKTRLRLFLDDDLKDGDVTSALLPVQKTKAVLQAKENCFIAGLEELQYLFSLKKCKTKLLVKDGSRVRKGKIIAEITGSNKSVLGVERTALNVISRMAAVATACDGARTLVSKRIAVALTRKTAPGFNLFDKKAAALAGVWPHRINLGSAIMLKDNHLKFFPTVLDAALAASKKDKDHLIELEVENATEAMDAVLGGVHIVMLDNFSIKDAKKTIKMIRKVNPEVFIELSGGINLRNLKSYAKLDADIISLGALTHSVKGINFSLEIKSKRK